MKKFNYKFKSLTMRIWTTFTAIILIIILSISFFYLFAFKNITEKAQTKDLKWSHDNLLKVNNFTAPVRFDEIGSLKGSDYYILNVDKNNTAQIININKAHSLPPENPGNVNSPFRAYDKSVKMWMSSYITPGTLYDKKVKASYNNIKFIFFISSIKYGTSGASYLITYMPEKQDNNLLYMVFWIGVLFIAIGFLCAKLVANYISKPLKELEN